MPVRAATAVLGTASVRLTQEAPSADARSLCDGALDAERAPAWDQLGQLYIALTAAAACGRDPETELVCHDRAKAGSTGAVVLGLAPDLNSWCASLAHRERQPGGSGLQSGRAGARQW